MAVLLAGASRSKRALAALRRHAYALAVIVVVLLVLLVFVQVERNAPIFSGQPLTWIDFDTHAEQTWRVTEALDRFGKSWAYDVQQLAGYPTGTVFDADNKGWELWTYALWKLGLSRAVAFNLFVFLAHLLLPAVVFLCARLFRLDRWEALLAVVLACGVWFFDGLARWSWYSGAVSYSIVCYLFMLPIALLYAHLRTGRRWLLVPLTVTMAAGHLIHPSTFILLVVPMTAQYARAFRRLRPGQHAGILLVALLTIAANAWWLLVAFRFAHYLTDHEPFFVGKLHHVLLDMGGLIDELTRTGLVGNRTGFRFLALIAAACTLVMWRRDRDDRLLPLGSGIGVLVGLAYVGGYFWLFRQVQPHRNVVPAALLASLPAAAFFGMLCKRRAFAGASVLARAALGIATFLGASHLAKDVLYFLPKVVPNVPALPTGEVMDITAYGFPEHRDFRHYPPDEQFDLVSAWVAEHDDGQSRFLVEWWVLGEHLLWRTHAQVLGGFRERNLAHTAANLFDRYPAADVADDVLASYLESYAVRWVIMTQPMPLFEGKEHVLQKVADVGMHRIYRTKVPVDLVQEGGGRVSAALNQIQVRASEPDRDVVLRFHWLETLVCEPGCSVVREPRTDDRVGFIRIPAPHPADFAVVNRY
ncbi:MAG: hypothetical protein MUF54_00330 [Polyangiaceae bacterium]|jgi:hypothetical protein|nr:hypothetical protein [Polyangiaceae bacterium]